MNGFIFELSAEKAAADGASARRFVIGVAPTLGLLSRRIGPRRVHLVAEGPHVLRIAREMGLRDGEARELSASVGAAGPPPEVRKVLDACLMAEVAQPEKRRRRM